MKSKVPITQRALIQRLNRVLAKRHERVCYDRRNGSYMHTGGVDSRNGFLIQQDVNLNALAKELGVLKPWEIVEL
jgi:hypothetical protein